MLVKLWKYNNYLEKKEYKKNIKKENEYEYVMFILKIEFNKIMIIFIFIKIIIND